MNRYDNKVVIVSGAGQGIGRSIAVAYAKAGANIVIAEKNTNLGKETADIINNQGGSAKHITTDVCVPADINSCVRKTVDIYGGIDILINNAAISAWKSPLEITVEEWDAVINTNLRGYFLFAREAAKRMKKEKRGVIINIASTRWLMSESNSEAYAASKGGVVSLTHALAASLGPDGIIVNCISPGWIETGNYEQLSLRDHKQHFSGRVGVPSDIVKACFYLSAPENDFVTGTNLVVDGGMTRKMIYVE